MYFTNARNKINTLNLIESSNPSCSTAIFMIESHRQNAKENMENKDFEPGEDILKKAVAEIDSCIGIVITVEQLKDLLCLYPFVRINLKDIEHIDSCSRDDLMNMMCRYIIGSDAPKFGDKLTNEEHELFYRHLNEEAILLGYKVTNE